MKYTVVLLKDNLQVGRYKLDEDLFNEYKKQLEPYISMPIPSKAVVCVETGEVFKNVNQAAKWIVKNGISDSFSIYATIRNVCHGKRKSAYGYHWKYA